MQGMEEQPDFFRKEKQAIMSIGENSNASKKNNSKGRQKATANLEDYKLGAKQRMLAALEIYNKPIFPCREEIYAILAVSAWEFLFKAKLIQKGGLEALKIETDDRKPKKWEKVVLTLRTKFGVEIDKKILKNLNPLREIRNKACHGSLGAEYIKKIFAFSLACFRNFLEAYKEWFEEDLLSEGFGIAPIFYYLPDKEKHTEIPVDLKERNETKDNIDILWSSNPYDESSKYHVFILVEIKIVPGTSSKSNKLLLATWDQNNPDAKPIKEDLSTYTEHYNQKHQDIQAKIKELNGGKTVPTEIRKKISVELKGNQKCAASRVYNTLKPADKKGNLTYYYNMSECVKVIKKYLPLKSSE